MRALSVVVCSFLVIGVAGCAVEVGGSTAELRTFCGGIAGLPCPTGSTCVDDPHDACDPDLGGADCGGVCRRVHSGGRCGDPARTYVSRDAAECQVIRFLCADGMEYFSDRCGCGCLEPASDCSGAAVLCAPGTLWDTRACACLPSGGEACGSRTCGAGEVCCNASCGICTPPDGFCTQQACVPTA